MKDTHKNIAVDNETYSSIEQLVEQYRERYPHRSRGVSSRSAIVRQLVYAAVHNGVQLDGDQIGPLDGHVA